MAGSISNKKKRKHWILFVALVAAVIAIRLALPYVILHYANKSLATMQGYRGHIEDIDIALLRGAYQIDSVYLNKVDSLTHKETPFIAASMIELSVEWKALLSGSIVGEAIFKNPVVRFTRDKVEPKDIQKDSLQFKKVLDGFMPLKVNRFEVQNGSIRYIDENSKPPVDIALTEAGIIGLNLINSYDSSGTLLPASIRANANIYGGTLAVNMKLDPLSSEPTFDVNAELKNTNLAKLNDFFKAYAKADVSRGTFGLYTEVAAKEGRFTGYVKPMINELKVLGEEDRRDNLLQKLWEGFVGGTAEVFENQRKDRLATKIPLAGKVETPDANVWYALSQVLQNAFIRALQPSLDQEINIGTVAAQADKKDNVLEKVFGKNNDDKQMRKEQRKERRQKKKQERRKRRAEHQDDEKS